VDNCVFWIFDEAILGFQPMKKDFPDFPKSLWITLINDYFFAHIIDSGIKI